MVDYNLNGSNTGETILRHYSYSHCRSLLGLLLLSLSLLLACTKKGPDTTSADEDIAAKKSAVVATDHPRLWVRSGDLSRLRSWATSSNPAYQQGLLVLANQGKNMMDSGTIPNNDSGTSGWEMYPSEGWAQVFAFMALVHPDASTRSDYAQRARTMLMHVIDRAAACGGGGAFCAGNFAISDRSRWWGDAFGTTVDWIYSTLSSADKAKIRTVFLRWVDENMHASTTDFNHPTPIGMTDDPELLKDQNAVRYSMNNYYTSHMRNIGLMAMSFDAADDPGNTLRDYIKATTGAWLYVTDYQLRNDQRGGLGPEGEYYYPEAIGPVTQLLLGLHTSGHDDTATNGQQVSIAGNPFWEALMAGVIHSASPDTAYLSAMAYDAYQMPGFGDSGKYWLPDMTGAIGPLAIFQYNTNDLGLWTTSRWIMKHLGPGGAARMGDRGSTVEVARNAIYYFLTFDPNAPAASDPRPTLGLTHFSEGLGHIYSRTSWSKDAAWLNYMCGWVSVDHQHAHHNQVQFYRKGEWLTREISGYDGMNPSKFHNTLTVENDPAQGLGGEDWANAFRDSGSQWIFRVADGDGKILTKSWSQGHLYVTGDTTDLYNAQRVKQSDAKHVSRSVLWIKPDHVLLYDRAITKTEGRFKRFWLHFEKNPTTQNNITTVQTAKGQNLFVTTLLPTATTITSKHAGANPAEGEKTAYELMVEATGGPADTRFLHLLQGADNGVAADNSQHIVSASGNFEGALFRQTAVLFAKDLAGQNESLSIEVPSDTQMIFVSGLTPDAKYDVSVQEGGTTKTISIAAGTTQAADEGGLLVWPEETFQPEVDGSILPPAADGGYVPPPPPPDSDGGIIVTSDGPIATTEDGTYAGTLLTGGCMIAATEPANQQLRTLPIFGLLLFCLYSVNRRRNR